MEEKFERGLELFPGKERQPAMFSIRSAHTLKWSEVNYTVATKGAILSNCWGSIESGTVSAVMGPSGILYMHFCDIVVR